MCSRLVRHSVDSPADECLNLSQDPPEIRPDGRLPFGDETSVLGTRRIVIEPLLDHAVPGFVANEDVGNVAMKQRLGVEHQSSVVAGPEALEVGPSNLRSTN